MVAAIDATALAVHLAQKTPEEGLGAAKRKKEFDEQASCAILVADSVHLDYNQTRGPWVPCLSKCS